MSDGNNRPLQASLFPWLSKVLDLGSSLLRYRKIWSDEVDVRTGTLTQVPVNPTDMVNKSYVDSLFGPTIATIREVDGTPSIAAPDILEFDQATGFVVSNPGGNTARVSLTSILNVREVDGTPSVSGVTQIQFDQADGFTVTDVGGGVVRIDSTGSFNLTVEEVDAAPSFANINTIRFDQADGFVVTQPGANLSRIDIDAATLRSAHSLAPSTAQYLVLASDAGLSAESVLDVSSPHLSISSGGGTTTITLQTSTLVYNAQVFS